jgi:DNA-binding MarR family transcriptional regulator
MTKRPTPSDDASGRYAYDGLERIMHERARLGILTSLASHPKGLPFNDLKELCALTDGNLSRHLQVLQEAGLVGIRKSTAKGRPQTRCRLTAAGRRKFLAYVAELERVVKDAVAADEARQEDRGDMREGWSPA